MRQDREYGSRGRVGVGTPQPNPTVEPEVAACLPPGISLLAVRLMSSQTDPKARLFDYVDNLGATLSTYSGLKLDAFGFANTLASYLIGHEREDREVDALSQKFGYPIITGAKAIVAALKHLGAKRIAIGAPYPGWARDVCDAYYRGAGFDVVALKHIEVPSTDIRSIYDLTSRDAIAALDGMDIAKADCIVFTGSGMPSLRAIVAAQTHHRQPTISTNLCLAWALSRAAGVEPPTGPHKLLNGWQQKVDAL